MADYQQKFNQYKEQLEKAIADILLGFKSDIPERLYDAMVYSACNGGKRIRGVLLMATSDILGLDGDIAIKYAATVEMIHGSSLIHDDLPCMDNDTMRRGKPCNHVVFGEAQALYAGLGLLNLAYEVLLEGANTDEQIKAISIIAKSAGPMGIMKGQSLDILYEGKEMDYNTLKAIHESKTGALIRASVLVPAILSHANDSVLKGLANYGENIGTAFQIVDDVLDVTGSSENLGKTAGKDIDSDKLTYVKLFGVDKAREMAEEHISSAISSLGLIKDNQFLIDTAKLILNRRK